MGCGSLDEREIGGRGGWEVRDVSLTVIVTP